MSLKIKPDKKAIYYNDRPFPRQFGLGREVKDEVLFNFIDTCRETFLRHIDGNKLTNQWVIYYAKSTDQAKRTKRFIEQCEKDLIKEKCNRSQIHAVGMKVCILPAEFWKPKFRLGLLTILIRAGKKYKRGDKINDLVFASPYIKSEGMEAAVKAFFAGKTLHSKDKDNYGQFCSIAGFWLDEFDRLTAEQAVERLKKE